MSNPLTETEQMLERALAKVRELEERPPVVIVAPAAPPPVIPEPEPTLTLNTEVVPVELPTPEVVPTALPIAGGPWVLNPKNGEPMDPAAVPFTPNPGVFTPTGL